MMRLRTVVVLVAAIFAVQLVSCSDTVTPPANTPILIVPQTIEFGSLRVGLTKDTSVRFSNTGTADLTITSQSFSSSQFLLADTNQRSITIQAGGYQDVRIRYMPKDAGEITAYDTIHSNAALTIVKLHAGAIALTRILQYQASADFGAVRLGMCADPTLGVSNPMTVTLRNVGNDTVRISSVMSLLPDFTILSNSMAVAPGDSGTVKIQFCPAKTGQSASTLSIASDATNAPSPMMLQGTGVPYSPGAGSSFTYTAIQLDENNNPVGGAVNLANNVISTGLTYNGKAGVTKTNDGSDSYFKIEDDGDVSVYSMGFPTVDSVTYFGGTWLKLPFLTRAQKVQLFTDTTTFTNKDGQIGLRVMDSATYQGDSTITVSGESLTVSRVDLTIVATYSIVGARQIIATAVVLYFSPKIGFIVLQDALQFNVKIVGTQVTKTGGGKFRILNRFSVN